MNISLPTLRKFVVIVLGVYFGILTLILVGSALSGELAWESIGSLLLYIGMGIFILAFLVMGATNRGDGASKSLRMRSDAEFKAWRKQERPIELVTWAIILAAAMMATTGYMLLYLLDFG
jgi:hypothetical protein